MEDAQIADVLLFDPGGLVIGYLTKTKTLKTFFHSSSLQFLTAIKLNF